MTRRIRLVGTVGGLELLDSSDQPGDPGSVAALAVQLSVSTSASATARI